jgi:hypothetical protein
MQVWTIVCGQTFATTTGRPLSPSQTRKNTSWTPRVLQIDQHAHPELGALTTDAHPQPQDVLVAVHGDPDRGVDGPVGDLTVADLDVDRIDNTAT